MDDLLTQLEQADPAAAPDIADDLAAALVQTLDGEPATDIDDRGEAPESGSSS